MDEAVKRSDGKISGRDGDHGSYHNLGNDLKLKVVRSMKILTVKNTLYARRTRNLENC